MIVVKIDFYVFTNKFCTAFQAQRFARAVQQKQ